MHPIRSSPILQTKNGWKILKEHIRCGLTRPGRVLVDYTAFQINMVAKGGENVAEKNASRLYFGTNVNPMVGYSEHWGYCRAMIYIDTAWESLIGKEETETDGPAVRNVQLSLTTMTNDAADRTAFQAFIPSKTWNPASITWDNMKSQNIDFGMERTGEAQYSTGSGKRMVFDITESYYNWLDKPPTRTGLLLQAAVEGGDDEYIPGSGETTKVNWAETFYNQLGGAAFGPRLEVAWVGELENVDLLTMDMSKFSVNVSPGVVESEAGGRNTKGILAYGASQAYSTVEYKIKEKDGEIAAEDFVEAHDEVDCPAFEEVDDDCILAKYQNSNWQSNPVLTFNPLQTDKIYYAEARGTGKEIVEDEAGNPTLGEKDITTEWKTTDEFLLYLVQASDILPRIARYYGVHTNTLMEDNMLGFQLAEAGDVIFIRNPGTEKPYTPSLTPDEMEEFIKNCLLNGIDPRCEVGGEPVNLSTGSFYMSQEDAAFDELDGRFSITRSYNGLTPYFRSEFGMGWNSLIGERIMVLKDGSILYTSNDGKGLVFTKEGEDTYKAPEGYDYELIPVDTIEIATGTSDPDAEDDTEEGTMTQEQTDAPSTFALDEEETDGAEGATEEESDVEPVKPATGWEISEPDGTVRAFNAYGLLVSEKNRKDHKTSYIYDDNYLLTEIITPSGKSIGITMLEDGKITDIELPDGAILTYEYDEEDNLVAMTNAQGDIKRYEYDENHRMTAWYDENGTKIIENIMDDEGRVIEQTDALGNVMYFAYSEGQTTMTDNNGNNTIYYLDNLKRNVGIKYGNGDKEYTTYSADNRIETKTNANGATTRYTYDENGNILTETHEDGTRASYTYNELNLPISAIDYEGNTTRFSYDEVGSLLSMTDGEGNATSYSYDELSRLVSMTDANGVTSDFTYDGSNAPIASFTDPEGGTSIFSYDEMNRAF